MGYTSIKWWFWNILDAFLYSRVLLYVSTENAHSTFNLNFALFFPCFLLYIFLFFHSKIVSKCLHCFLSSISIRFFFLLVSLLFVYWTVSRTTKTSRIFEDHCLMYPLAHSKIKIWQNVKYFQLLEFLDRIILIHLTTVSINFSSWPIMVLNCILAPRVIATIQ